MENNITAFEKRLASAFQFPASEYKFVAEFESKDDICACGHIIDTVYLIEHPNGHKLQLGSDCIHTFECLGAAVDAHLKEKKKQKKLEEEVKNSQEYEVLVNEAKALKQIVLDYKNQHGYIERELFFISVNSVVMGKKLKTLKGKIKKQREFNEELKKTLILFKLV